jgi:hypothetical protein
MTPRRIELHIEELVLNGFSQLDGHAVAEAIEAELGAGFARVGVNIGEGGSRDRIDAGSVTLPYGILPAGVGAGLGERIYGRLTP